MPVEKKVFREAIENLATRIAITVMTASNSSRVKARQRELSRVILNVLSKGDRFHLRLSFPFGFHTLCYVLLDERNDRSRDIATSRFFDTL